MYQIELLKLYSSIVKSIVYFKNEDKMKMKFNYSISFFFT